MKKLSRLLVLILVLALLGSILPASLAEEKDYSTHLKISMGLVTTNTNVNDVENDAFAKWFNEKFNIEWDIVAIATEDQCTENYRIWVNSGDIPDVCNWGYVHADAVSWVEQDLIKRLPDDWRERWPNIAKAYDDSGVGKAFDEMFGGTYYLPKPIYSTNKPVDILIPHTGVWYRRDWAEAVGTEIKDYYTTREIMDMMLKIKEQDPGKVGEALVPLEVPTANLPEVFVYPNSLHSRNTQQYYLGEDGVYHWGPADPETLEGLKLWREAYDMGILHKEFYTLPVGRPNEASMNQAGTAAMNVAAGMASVGSRQATFLRTTQNVDPAEALAYAFVVDKDGDYLAGEIPNFAGTVFFSPNLDDEKFNRIMDIYDFSCTDEAQNAIRMGFEGEDWEVNADGEIVSLLPPDMQPAQKYFCVQPLYTGMLVLPDNFQLVNPILDKMWRDVARGQYVKKTAMAKDGYIAPLDYDVYFYNSMASQRANFNLAEEYASIVLKGPNVEESFNAWVAEKMPVVQPLLDELTAMANSK